MPTGSDQESWQVAVRALVTIAGIGAAVHLILRQVSRQFDDTNVPLTGLLTALVAGVLLFALADYLVAVADPGQFVDLNTRVDALYFALSTLATIGFGDVYASGQLARSLLCGQMLFNAIIIATGLSVLSKQLAARIRQQRRSVPALGGMCFVQNLSVAACPRRSRVQGVAGSARRP